MPSGYGLFDELTYGSESESLARSAANRNFQTSLHYARKSFGSFLNNAADDDEFSDRLEAIHADVHDIADKHGAVDKVADLLEALADDYEHRGDFHEANRKIAEDDKDDDDDQFNGWKDGTPPWVDTDEDDDHDRDDDSDDKDDDDDKDDSKKESSRTFVSHDDIDYDQLELLKDWPLEPNVVDSDFEGDVNDMQSDGDESVGAPKTSTKQAQGLDQMNERTQTQPYTPGPDAGAGVWEDGAQNQFNPQGMGQNPYMPETGANPHAQNEYAKPVNPFSNRASRDLPRVARNVVRPKGRAVEADGRHLNPEAPAPSKYQWTPDENGQEVLQGKEHRFQRKPVTRGVVNDGTKPAVVNQLGEESQFSQNKIPTNGAPFAGIVEPYGNKQQDTRQIKDFSQYGEGQDFADLDSAKAEVEKFVPETGKPGKHRSEEDVEGSRYVPRFSSLPRVPRH